MPSLAASASTSASQSQPVVVGLKQCDCKIKVIQEITVGIYCDTPYSFTVSYASRPNPDMLLKQFVDIQAQIVLTYLKCSTEEKTEAENYKNEILDAIGRGNINIYAEYTMDLPRYNKALGEFQTFERQVTQFLICPTPSLLRSVEVNANDGEVQIVKTYNFIECP